MRFHLHSWEPHEESTDSLPARRCKKCGRVEHHIVLRARWEHAPELEGNEMDTARS